MSTNDFIAAATEYAREEVLIQDPDHQPTERPLTPFERSLVVRGADWARGHLSARLLPDPQGGCTCIEHEQDAGGGHAEYLTEYDPTCPEHSEHVYNPRTGVWERVTKESSALAPNTPNTTDTPDAEEAP